MYIFQWKTDCYATLGPKRGSQVAELEVWLITETTHPPNSMHFLFQAKTFVYYSFSELYFNIILFTFYLFIQYFQGVHF